MKRGGMIALIVAGVLVLAGVILVAIGIGMSRADWFGLISTESVENTHEIAQTFENISIDTDTAEVLLLAAEDGSCRVECCEQEKVYHTVTRKDGTLHIRVVDERKWYEHIQIVSPKMTVRVYLPGTEYGALDIATDTGRIEVCGGIVYSSIDLESDTGLIDCRASAKGDVRLTTDTGAVRAEGVEAKTLQLESDTGTVSLSHVNVQEGITVENGTGKILAEGVRAASLCAQSSTGRQHLSDVVATGEMRLRSGTGDIELKKSDAAELYIEANTGDVTASLLTPKICFASSDTGRVDVPKSTEGGRCEIETDTGSIQVSFVQSAE